MNAFIGVMHASYYYTARNGTGLSQYEISSHSNNQADKEQALRNLQLYKQDRSTSGGGTERCAVEPPAPTDPPAWASISIVRLHRMPHLLHAQCCYNVRNIIKTASESVRNAAYLTETNTTSLYKTVLHADMYGNLNTL